MKTIFLFLFIICTTSMLAQDVFGNWKTIDDKTGKEKSIVKIYEEDGRVYGKIIEILNPKRQNALCTKCKGKNKGRPIAGLVIINGLQKDGDEYNGAKILDPESGKTYKCLIALEDKNKLKVRGYLGFSLLGRTQYWIRAED